MIEPHVVCDCIKAIDAKLSEHNTRIMLPIVFGSDRTVRVMIVTDQIQTGRGKKRAVGLFATYCPFCGTPYEPQPAVAANEASGMMMGSKT